MWRSTTLVVAAVMGATAASITSLVQDEWQLFKLEYNKQYNTDVKEQFRMKIFMDNKHKVLEHNKHFAQNMTSFKLKLNHLGDMLRQEIISSMTGFTEMDTKNGIQDITAIYIPPDDDVLLPSSVDWRKKGAVTGVKNQGQCASGWAFSTTGSLEGQHFRRWSRLLNISEQNLIDCCHLCQGCQGARMDYAFTYIMQNNGIDSESYYPYEARALGYVSIPTGDEIALKAAVANIGPVSVAIDASLPSLHYYTHGSILSRCVLRPSTRLTHRALVVGYGSDWGHEYWVVKNSWSPYWGDHGYIKIARNRNNQCGIATSAGYPLV
ncbi:Cathepsin L-like 3 [Homarus americanus]|uniref:Cathepsin L-like 3 n=1 Tax=Homarus americanus TaxID=6706 RepID=A0A8J5MYV9_HOMAM|nr:Cathepsin L-like 3 [Homarus americanus]